LLYIDLDPLLRQIIAAFDSGEGLGLSLEEDLFAFSRPLFVFGVICAAGLPELKSRSKKPKPNSVKKGS
jgi:hypothetical protein